ncbi:hypothetical protein L484_016240 [Morus notabilis]|uniref:Uncharacterized protein n=1 Tax=Morus notabilis TaxID=981085 RepID=W9QSG5_9ROSA|nr:hypothetical protein L484_016240 [Morus notabilis]
MYKAQLAGFSEWAKKAVVISWTDIAHMEMIKSLVKETMRKVMRNEWEAASVQKLKGDSYLL